MPDNTYERELMLSFSKNTAYHKRLLYNTKMSICRHLNERVHAKCNEIAFATCETILTLADFQ